MRAIHPELVRMLRKASITGRARVIPEAIVVDNEDLRAFDTDWNNADSPTGLQVAPNGDLRLTGSFSTTVEHTNSDTYMTDLDRASPWSVAKVTWAGTLDRDFEIQQIKAYLHPKRTAAAKEVVWWKMELYRVHRVWPASVFIAETFEIQSMGSALRVAASGTTEAEYIFDFSAGDNGPKPKMDRPIIMRGAMAIRPTTYIRILALKADGSAAGNVGFSADTATPSVTTSGVTLEQTTLTENAVGDGRGRWSEPDVPVDECPRLAIIAESYSDATVTFSVAGGGTIINLGAAPTKDLECVLVGRTPSDTAIVGEIRKAAPDAWTEFLDGDLIGVDNSLPGGTGGKDLSGLTPTQQTYEIRAQLKTNTALNTTPRLKQLGVRELTRISFDRLATVDVEWNVHPYEMRSEISRAVITSIRDGREDFNDQITELLVDYDVAEIAWRIMIGHPDLDRHKWLHIDTFPIAYDYDPRATEIECQWDSALTLLRAALPVASGSPLTRDILNYNATVGIETLKEVSDDLLDGQIGLAGKYRGQGITDDTTTIAKRIGERDPDMVVTALSDAKTEADAVAFIAGGAWGTDAGRVRFFDLFADDFVVMLFHEREITVESVSPGLALRTPEVFLAYDYDVQSRQYTLEHRGFHGVALTALGISNLGPPKRLSDTVGKWIDDTTLAETVVERHFNAFGMGVRLWRFRCIYPYPELQFGDRVIVPTKQFVMRDPLGGRELRGQLWAIGTIVGVHDVLGTAFTIWIRSLSDILASSEAVTLTKFAVPQVVFVYIQVDNDTGIARPVLQATDALSVRVASSTSAFPSLATTQAASTQALDSDGGLVGATLATLTANQTLFVTVLAYEKAAGAGAESRQLYKAQVRRRKFERIFPWDDDDYTVRSPSSTGRQIENVTVFVDTNGNFGPNRHNETAQAQDGDAVSFGADFESIPQITFLPQVALTYRSADSGSDQVVDMKATNPTVSGFTARAKIITGAAASAIVDGFSASQNQAGPENGTVTLSNEGAVVYSNLEDANTTSTMYNVYYDIDATGMNVANRVTVEIYSNDGATSTTWTLRSSRTYDNTMNATDVKQSFTAALGANYDIRIRITYLTSPLLETATVTALGEDSSPRAGVEFNKITAGTENDATPNTGDAVAYFAMEAP